MTIDKLLDIVKTSAKCLRSENASNEIFSIAENADSMPGENENAQTIEIIEKLVMTVCKWAAVPNTDYERDLPSDHFWDYTHDATIELQILFEIFSFLQEKQDSKSKINKSVVVQTLILCASHSEPFDWTAENSKRLSNKIIQCLVRYYTVNSIEELLTENSVLQTGLAKAILLALMPHLTPDVWKENPASKHVFKWTLEHIKHPNLGPLLPEVLPPSLLFIDDYVTQNKVLGIQCVQHIISHTNSTELKWYGRAEVIYSALEHLLYSREAELVPVLYPCILKILSAVELTPTKNLQFNRYDRVFGILLTNMEQEQKLTLRTMYALQLQRFIEILQITVVKHMKILLRVVESYLEIYDNPEEITRKAILDALQTLLLVAWPRISFHMETILQFLLRLVYDLEADENQTSLNAKNELISEAEKCIALVKLTSPEKFQKLATSLVDGNIESSVKTLILQALKTEDCKC